MIYVLAGDQRETQRWARKHGIPLRTARHVFDAQTIPGRLGKNRVVELPGFATRRNRHAILARLKFAKALKIEKIDPDEPFSLVQMPRDDMAQVAEAIGAEFVDTTESDPSSDLTDPEPEVGPTVTVTPTDEEPPASHTELVNRVLPAKAHEVIEVVQPVDVPDEDETDEADPFDEFLGLTPENEIKAEETQLETPADDETVIEVAEKPKRTRRTKVQMAYDAALADWESNGGSLEAVIEARDALSAKHPDDERLLTAPQSDDEVEAQAEDDDALDF